MSSASVPPAATRLAQDGRLWRIAVSGHWEITGRLPHWAEVAAQAPAGATALRIEPEELGEWDSSLAIFVRQARAWAAGRQVTFDDAALPETLRRLAAAETKAPEPPRPESAAKSRLEPLFLKTGLFVQGVLGEFLAICRFLGLSLLGALQMVRRPRRFRWADMLHECQQHGAAALPIVGLISFLVGVILAYQSAIQLRQFGAEIWVADFVGLAVVREMGPIMAAIVLAGRTGAAFAAQLGTMKTNEEIDALETLGISPVNFLVLPRLLALFLMMPLLTLYADALGILGGYTIGTTMLNIPPVAYWLETRSAVDYSDVGTGLIKCAVFGQLIALSGCHRGLECERSAAGIGRATTTAVVMGILLVIVSDALFAVLFNVLRL